MKSEGKMWKSFDAVVMTVIFFLWGLVIWFWTWDLLGPTYSQSTYWLCSLDGHKLVVALLPADIAKSPVVPGVLGDVADLVDRVVMQQHLHGGDVKCYKRGETV